MYLLISLSALLFSVILIQVGSGSLGPLDALAGAELGFTTSQIGLLGSAHFVGLLIGCIVNPILIRRSGHARGFAMMAAASAISSLLHPIYQDIYFWCVLRMLTGFAIAGAYTVIESWLQAKLINANRGRVFSVYRVSDMSGTILAQAMVAVLDPTTYVAYNLVAMIACMSLLPLALTQSVPPELPERVVFKPFFALTLSPLAGMGIFAAGMTNAAFRMVGPVYATEIGLDSSSVAIFLVMGVLGGALVQIPAGYITDRFNRRHVLVGFSIASAVVCLATGLTSYGGFQSPMTGFAMAFMFGVVTMPIYSVCATHANDFARIEDLVHLSASLILVYSLGGIASPLLSGWLIQNYGPGAMFIFIAMIHVVLLIYSIWRMTIRPAIRITSYRYVPRTTMFINLFLRPRNHDTDDPPKS
ncbi:MAG: MFS transporter [Candidatus Puniceispirillales bacterium]